MPKLFSLCGSALLLGGIFTSPAQAQIQGHCAPRSPATRILDAPRPNATHPDWQDSAIGTAWTLEVDTTEIDEFGTEFIGGVLITPRGETGSKPIWGVRSEWLCNLQGQVPEISSIPEVEQSYCSATLQAQDPTAQITLRSSPGTEFDQEGYGLVGDWVHLLRSQPEGDPKDLAQAQDVQGMTWFRVGFPSSGARGWIREDLLVPECYD